MKRCIGVVLLLLVFGIVFGAYVLKNGLIVTAISFLFSIAMIAAIFFGIKWTTGG